MNSFGRALRFQLFGESHGRGVGAVIDGVPAGLPFNDEVIQVALDRRRPGTSVLTSARRESDRLEVLSGVYEGHCTGAPLTFWIANEDARSASYEATKNVPRPGHADWPAHVRYGGFGDRRGGGHFSGRLTAPLVAAGTLAEAILAQRGVVVGAHLHGVGSDVGSANGVSAADMRAAAAGTPLRTAHVELAPVFERTVQEARRAKDSVGGLIEFRAEGMPVGVGEPWSLSVEAHLSALLFSIPAVKGVSFGAGFAAAAMRGSTHNDAWAPGEGGNLTPVTNHAGGVLGGLTTGAPVWGHVAIKPTSSIAAVQDSVDVSTGEPVQLSVRGRHDPIIALRAVSVVQAAVAFGLADLLMASSSEAVG